MTRHTWFHFLLALAFGAGAALKAAEAPPAKPSGKQAAIESAKKAVKYLLDQANDDGTFGKSPSPLKKMPGIVGLVVYGVANSPDKPKADKTPALAKAAEYLVSVQQPDGAIALPQFGVENYTTSVAIIALKALHDPKYDEALKKALDYTLSCQLDERKGYDVKEHDAAYGAFGYGGGRKGDLSNTSFSLDALKAMGVKEDSPAFKNALIFIKRCQDNKETNDSKLMVEGDDTGGLVYRPGNSEFGMVKSRGGNDVPKPYGNMTYAGIKSLIYCGVKADSPELKAAWKWIKNNYTVKEMPGGSGTQGYYYYVVAMSKAFAAAGVKDLDLPDGKKANWANDLSSHLISLQSADGSFANKDGRWMEDDAVLATAYALQALNLCIEAMP